MKVGELWVSLGIRREAQSWNASTGWLKGLKGAALGLAGYFGLKGIGGAVFGFNSMLEKARNRVAETMAIARHSTLAEQYQEASKAVDELNDIATKLPGTTEDYVNAFALISGPILSAKGSMKELQQITVSTLAFAELVGRQSGEKIDVATASREIQRGIDGTSRASDRLILKMLEVNGVSMKQFKAMSKHQREQLIDSEAVQKVTDDYNKARNATFAGQKEQLQDRGTKFLAKIGEGLFGNITARLTKINKWFDDNKKKVDGWAEYLSNVITNLFDYVIEYGGKAFEWLSNHTELIKQAFIAIGVVLGGRMLMSAVAFGRTWLPIYFTVKLLYDLFMLLRDSLGDVGAGIATAFAAGALLLFLGKAKELLGVMGQLGVKGGGGGGIGIGGTATGIGVLSAVEASIEAAKAIKNRKENPAGLVDYAEAANPLSVLFPGSIEELRTNAESQRQANMRGEVTPTSGSVMDLFSSAFLNMVGPTMGVGGAPDFNTNVTNNITVSSAKDVADVAGDATKDAMDSSVREAASSYPFLPR